MKNTGYKLFTKQGKFVKNVQIGEKCRFKTMAELEEFLKKEGLYAHRIESFENRPYWKGWTFVKKLENLGWEFNKKGELINTEW